jgi:hypothetical protein
MNKTFTIAALIAVASALRLETGQSDETKLE